MARKLRSLSKFSCGELLVLFQLVALALAARAALTFLRLSRVMELVARGAGNRFLRCLPLFQNRYELTRLTRLADIAARNAQGDGRCLIRSLLVFWLLKSRGEAAELFVGVRREVSALHSHAWIESRGRILIDSPETAGSYATLLRY